MTDFNSGVKYQIKVTAKPSQIEVKLAMPDTGPRIKRHNRSGPNAAPRALQAKRTVLKMDSSMNKAAVMAAALITKMAKRSRAMLLRFTFGMS